jgi:hypothetical protein
MNKVNVQKEADSETKCQTPHAIYGSMNIRFICETRVWSDICGSAPFVFSLMGEV